MYSCSREPYNRANRTTYNPLRPALHNSRVRDHFSPLTTNITRSRACETCIGAKSSHAHATHDRTRLRLTLTCAYKIMCAAPVSPTRTPHYRSVCNIYMLYLLVQVCVTPRSCTQSKNVVSLRSRGRTTLRRNARPVKFASRRVACQTCLTRTTL